MGRLTTLALAMIAANVFAASVARTADLIIHAGRLIDGVSNTPRTQVSVLIHDGRIVSVESGFGSPEGYQVIDLSQATLLPGLIDCHDHITVSFHKGVTVPMEEKHPLEHQVSDFYVIGFGSLC